MMAVLVLVLSDVLQGGSESCTLSPSPAWTLQQARPAFCLSVETSEVDTRLLSGRKRKGRVCYEG